MATLTTKLTLTSSNATSDTLNVTVSDNLSVKQPLVGLSRIVAGTAGGGCIIIAADNPVTYLYVKHTGTTDGTTASTANVDIEDTANNGLARLAPGEFAWFPANNGGTSTGIQLQTTTGSVLMEYAYWTKE